MSHARLSVAQRFSAAVQSAIMSGFSRRGTCLWQKHIRQNAGATVEA
jgi:hypothetical protein